MDENYPVIIVDADDLVPQVNPTEIPSAPPEGITDPEDIDNAAIDKGANHVYTSMLTVIGDAADNAELQQALERMLLDALLRLDLAANPKWARLETYHEKAVDAALRIRLGLIELLMGSALLLEHLRRLRGPGLSLN